MCAPSSLPPALAGGLAVILSCLPLTVGLMAEPSVRSPGRPVATAVVDAAGFASEPSGDWRRSGAHAMGLLGEEGGPSGGRRHGGGASVAAVLGVEGGQLLDLQAGHRSSTNATKAAEQGHRSSSNVTRAVHQSVANVTRAEELSSSMEFVEDNGFLNLTGSLDCLENNGGSCTIQSCYAWRGPHQTCHLFRCFCTKGTCAGTDGKCHNQQNVLLGSSFRLRNVRWPNYFMYMSRWNTNIWIGKTPGQQADWEIRQLPGSGYAMDPVDFLVTARTFPGQALRMQESQSCDSNNACSTDVHVVSDHITLPMETGIQHLALDFERIPEKPEAVMIASFQYPRKHLYVGHMSWQVKAYDGDPGTGGYWTFDPPLTNTTMNHLRFYHGPRCTWDCGLGCLLAPNRGLLVLLALALFAPRGA